MFVRNTIYHCLLRHNLNYSSEYFTLTTLRLQQLTTPFMVQSMSVFFFIFFHKKFCGCGLVYFSRIKYSYGQNTYNIASRIHAENVAN